MCVCVCVCVCERERERESEREWDLALNSLQRLLCHKIQPCYASIKTSVTLGNAG